MGFTTTSEFDYQVSLMTFSHMIRDLENKVPRKDSARYVAKHIIELGTDTS